MRTGAVYTEGSLQTNGIMSCFDLFVLPGLLRSECVYSSTT